ncbi:MAG: T9SS type A sorting domain-containing protein [Bacteroidales bacterium]
MNNFKHFILLFALIPFFPVPLKAQVVCPIPEVSLGNDTLICPGGSLYLDAGSHTTTIWSDGSIDRYLLVTEPGTYFVWVENECGATNSDTINIELAENPVLSLIVPEREYFCKGEQADLTAEVTNDGGNVIYEWVDQNSNDATLVVDTSGTYEIKVTNEFGCEANREVFIEFQYPYEEEKILLTSFDPTINKNIVVWSRTPNRRTQSYILFNGNTEDNIFAEANYDSQNFIVDEKSTPFTRPSYYNIEVKDSCNNTSSFRPENLHRTMHLNASTSNRGFATLEWESYLGFEYDKFYIYRGQDPDKMEVLDSVIHEPGKDKLVFTDDKAEKDILYYYQVKVKTPEIIYLDNPSSRKAGSGPFVHSLSNLEDNLIKSTGADEIEIIQQYFRVYPNPSRDFVRISFSIEKEHHIMMTLYDLSGKELMKIMNEAQPAGEVTIEIEPGTFSLEPGVYILQMKVDDNYLLTRKLVRQ